MKLPRSMILATVILFPLALVGAALLSAQASNQPDPTPLPLTEAIRLLSEPSGKSVVRLYFNDRDHLDQVAGQLDIWEVDIQEGFAVAAVSPEQLHWLEVLGYRPEVDLAKTTFLQVPMAPLDPRFYYFDDYYTNPYGLYIIDFLTTTNTSFPDLTELFDIGDAWLADQPGEHARDIRALRITNEDPSYGEIADKPVFFLFANIHAREVALPELAIRYIKYLTTGYEGEGGYGFDPDVTWLVNHNVLYVLIMQNPDGHWVNEQNTSVNRRKNMDNDDGCLDPDPGSWGVDLNRNHSFLWGCCGGSSVNPCSETYRGPTPASEPETRAFQDFFSTVIPDQNGSNDDDEIPPPAPLDSTGIFLSLHSYADEILWPWGFTTSPSPNFDELQTIGRKFAYYNNFLPTGFLYTVDGASDDWTYGKFGVASFTFEVGPNYGTCWGFFPPYECIDGAPGYPEDFWAENKSAFLYAHKIARTPYMTAYGPDAQELSTVPNEVYRGQPLDLSATIEDHRYGGDSVGLIAGAEYFIDAPGEDGSGISMSAVDGDWGELSELVLATLDTHELEPGQHYILVHGKNDVGDWGPFSAVFVTVTMPDYSAVLIPENDHKQADPGEAVTYTLQIHNYGANEDTYDITINSLWPASAPISIGPLANGESALFDVIVTIPLSATNGESDLATVGIQSQNDPAVIASSTLVTSANLYALTLSSSQDSKSGLPDTDVVYSIEVTNIGTISDTYDLFADSIWTVTIPDRVGPLDASETVLAEVLVNIPPDAKLGDINITTISAASQNAPQVTGQVVLTTIRKGYQVYLPISFRP